MIVMKFQNIVITDETGCKSSLVSVYTICHFKTTIYTQYIAGVKRGKKDQTDPFVEVRSGFTPIHVRAISECIDQSTHEGAIISVFTQLAKSPLPFYYISTRECGRQEAAIFLSIKPYSEKTIPSRAF